MKFVRQITDAFDDCLRTGAGLVPALPTSHAVTRKPQGGLPLQEALLRAWARARPNARTLLAALFIAATLVAIGQSGGCVDQAAMREQIDTARQDLGVLREALAAREHALRRAMEDPAAPADLVAQWQHRLAIVQNQLAATDHALAASADHQSDPSNGAGALITRTVGAVAPFVPEPYRLPLVLSAGLAASLARGAQLKRAARAIARGVQHALDADPLLAERFTQQRDAVRAQQPPLARRIVDEAQGKRRQLPI